MQSVVIVGAGAMGCLFAARLAEAGAQVTLVDVDRSRLDALARNGITIGDDAGTRNIRVAAATAPELRKAPDLLMLFTKGMHSAVAARSVAHLAGADTYVLTLQNGIGNAEILAEIFAPERVLMGVTTLPSNLEDSTRISSHGDGYIVLGPLLPEAEDGAKAAARLLYQAGLKVKVEADVRIAVWEKVAFNAALNPLSAITGLTNGGIDTAEGRRIAFAVVAETAATATARGIAVDECRIRTQIEDVLAHHRDHRTSMLQDLLAGRPTEIESINGAIVREAQQVGVATPVTSVLADLIRLVDSHSSGQDIG